MNTNKKPECVVTLDSDAVDTVVNMYKAECPKAEPLKLGTLEFDSFVNNIINECAFNVGLIERLKSQLAFIESSLQHTKEVLQRQGQTHAKIYEDLNRQIMRLKGYKVNS